MRGLKRSKDRGRVGGGRGSDGSHPGFIEAGVGRVRPEDGAKMETLGEVVEVDARMVEGASNGNGQGRGDAGEGGDAVEVSSESGVVLKGGVVGGDEAGMGEKDGAIRRSGESSGEGFRGREEGGGEGRVVAEERRRAEGGAEARENGGAVERGLADQWRLLVPVYGRRRSRGAEEGEEVGEEGGIAVDQSNSVNGNRH